MDGHSWSDKKKKEAILSSDAIASLARKPDGFSHSRKFGLYRSPGASNNFLIVGRAYNEPQGINPIENILLERDFIID